MTYTPYNYTTLSDRWQLTTRYLSRIRRRDARDFVVALISLNSWKHLTPAPPLDGLSLYRQALSKLVLPSQLGQPGGKVIMLISRIN